MAWYAWPGLDPDCGRVGTPRPVEPVHGARCPGRHLGLMSRWPWLMRLMMPAPTVIVVATTMATTIAATPAMAAATRITRVTTTISSVGARCRVVDVGWCGSGCQQSHVRGRLGSICLRVLIADQEIAGLNKGWEHRKVWQQCLQNTLLGV